MGFPPPSVLQTTILNQRKGWEPPVTPHPHLGPSLTFFVSPPLTSSLWTHLTSAAALLIHRPPREVGLRFESENSLKLLIVFYLRNSSVPTLSKNLRENKGRSWTSLSRLRGRKMEVGDRKHKNVLLDLDYFSLVRGWSLPLAPPRVGVVFLDLGAYRVL